MHRRFWFYVTSCFLSVAVLISPLSLSAETPGYNLIDWNDLMPEPWVKEMTKEMAAVGKLSNLQDSSDEANKAMAAMRKKFDEAPIVKSQLNKKVRLPGYVVPLDAERSEKREFLLVPYFGACIHTPPASQSNCADSPDSSKQNQEVTRVHGHRMGRGRDQGRAGLNLPRGQRIFARGCFCGSL